MNDFINFLKQKENIKEQIKENMIEPTGCINCSQLSKYYKKNNDFLNLLNDLHIEHNKVNFQISQLSLLPNNVNGVYTDYLIRYKICVELKREFYDDRCCLFLGKDKSFFDIEMPPYEMMFKSYENMRTSNATDNDILNVSLCHFFSFKEYDERKYFNYFINKKEDNYDQLQQFIKNKINAKENILLNPTLGNIDMQIGADADIIIDKELIDIKCSINKLGCQMSDFTQLILYVCLYYYQTGIKCNKITILNPVLSCEKSVDLSGWNNFDKVISILRKRVGLMSNNSDATKIENFTQFLNNRFSLIYNAGIDT